ncbi:hypothetical protein HZU38_29505 [Mycolicibacterium vanbaalenii]|uniref:hypothetical protein n=1 Tax=Mycolicibacterium vanbaalenii TaxID=110539 RepID=UPI001F24A5B2|nr:hypothetical protein [Mycolicibacterium vanbaalenii]UJL28874.1 hypothetical protein HZU38_29505 [Mycolicibacterium vanbaalenii]WND55588.1 hypothetical protein QQA43_23105 [Mycolicibacterium vanbaalenii]
MAKGISAHGDVLVNETADGVDLNEIWAEIQQALELYNAERSAVASLLSYRTVQVADAVPQSISSESFEEATEFGVPRAIRPPSDVLRLGYDFKDYDISLRATWKFLREATAEQVTAQITRVIEADNKNVTGAILNRLFNPQPRFNEWNHTVYPLWTGTDGMSPPPYLGRTFPSDTTHYLTTGSTVLDAQDIEDMIRLIKVKGYGQVGTTMLVLANPDDVDASLMTSWRAGVEYRTGGPKPKWDFIPSALMPAWIGQEEIHGPIPASDYNGLQVWGSYNSALLIQSNFVPLGYVAVVASGGPNSDMNPVAFREHPNPAYQGLRHIPGNGPYPLQDSFFVRGFGTGVRHRSAAVCMKITTNPIYTAPAIPR